MDSSEDEACEFGTNVKNINIDPTFWFSLISDLRSSEESTDVVPATVESSHSCLPKSSTCVSALEGLKNEYYSPSSLVSSAKTVPVEPATVESSQYCWPKSSTSGSALDGLKYDYSPSQLVSSARTSVPVYTKANTRYKNTEAMAYTSAGKQNLFDSGKENVEPFSKYQLQCMVNYLIEMNQVSAALDRNTWQPLESSRIMEGKTSDEMVIQVKQHLLPNKNYQKYTNVYSARRQFFNLHADQLFANWDRELHATTANAPGTKRGRRTADSRNESNAGMTTQQRSTSKRMKKFR